MAARKKNHTASRKRKKAKFDLYYGDFYWLLSRYVQVSETHAGKISRKYGVTIKIIDGDRNIDNTYWAPKRQAHEYFRIRDIRELEHEKKELDKQIRALRRGTQKPMIR